MIYPDQRHLLEMTTIRRERLLPEDALGQVEAREGDSIKLRDVVARGVIPSRYRILDAVAALRLRRPEDLDELLLVQEGDTVEVKTPLAVGAGRRPPRLLSPVKGRVAYIGEGRIILQETPRGVTLEAGIEGQVIAVRAGRGVVIETFGGLVQGVWGNGRRVNGVLRVEPEDGLESIYGDELQMQYRGAVLVTRRPLKETGLIIMQDQGFAGIIAPSMEADLIEPVLKLSQAILLTEGFGAIRMSAAVFNILNGFVGRQTALDAALPGRENARRPEAIINPSARTSSRPPRANPDQMLQVGMMVRLVRPPRAGQLAKVLDLPKQPVLLDNGLRVRCAQVETITGERVMIPLANLETFGK